MEEYNLWLLKRLDVETFCREFEKLEFQNIPDGMSFRGASLGCSSFPVDGNDISKLLHLADFRMYQIKKEKHKKESGSETFFASHELCRNRSSTVIW